MQRTSRNRTPPQNNQHSVSGGPLSTTMQSSPRVQHSKTHHNISGRRLQVCPNMLKHFVITFYLRNNFFRTAFSGDQAFKNNLSEELKLLNHFMKLSLTDLIHVILSLIIFDLPFMGYFHDYSPAFTFLTSV